MFLSLLIIIGVKVISCFQTASIDYCPDNFNTSKFCNARGRIIHHSLWRYHTGALCYSYTNTIRLNFQYTLEESEFECENRTFIIITSEINGINFSYDYTNKTSLNYIRKSFKDDDYFNLWISCCQEAVECCNGEMDEDNILPSLEFPCPAIWDGWTCFPPTASDTIVEKPCSRQAYSSKSSVCLLNSQKYCFPNGTWNQKTNYEICAIASVLRARHYFHVWCLSFAVLFITPAPIIFAAFGKFRKSTRLSLHRNLIIALIIRYVLSIMSKVIIILDALQTTNSNNVMTGNSVFCRILAFLENVAKNSIYACMLVDGFYLHKLIVRIFANEPQRKHMYWVVIVLSILPSLIWAILRASRNADNCWMVDHDGDQWIVDGFRIGILIINTLLLIDIIRVMVTKLKHNSTTKHTMATFRATLFLIPLFGVHIVVFADRDIVTDDTCFAEDVYYYSSYFMEALQGVMVALLFCYFSNEVHTEFKNLHRKLSIQLQQTFNWRSKANRRRTTAATYVGEDSLEHRKTTIKLKESNQKDLKTFYISNSKTPEDSTI